jgi:hypothetical protein
VYISSVFGLPSCHHFEVIRKKVVAPQGMLLVRDKWAILGIIGNTKSKEYQGFFLSLELAPQLRINVSVTRYSYPLR